MARMYSRRKGKAGSKKPALKKVPPWATYSPEEIGQLVIKLAKTEKNPAKIGMILRDSYGIPDVKTATGKKIMALMSETKPKLPPELTNLLKRVIALTKHTGQHKKDQTSLRGLQLTESKIRRLIKHYKKTKKIPQDWAYHREKAKLLLE